MGNKRDSSTVGSTEAEQISDGFIFSHLHRQQNPKTGTLTSYFQASR